MPALVARVAADASLIGVAVIWGATFPLAKIVLPHLAPFQYLGVRFAIAALLLLPLVRRDLPRLRAADVRRGVLTGVVLFAGFALQTVGLQHTTASKAGLITGLNVVIVPVLLLLWLRRAPSAPTAVGVALAACGLWLLAWRGERLALGDALVLGCAVVFALHIILLGRFAPAIPPAGFALLQVATVAVLGTVAALAWEPRPAPLSWGVAGAVAFNAVGGTLVGFLGQTWAQRTVPPTRAGLLLSVEPVAAVGFSVVWLGDVLGARQAIGAAAILLGVVLGEVGRRSEG